ncbi:YciI family protein [Oceanomicrobium pacificus]|uniref:YCII-related domain-containing protein n=1 Tax=Oceanomicrobium pacificus TaxID=2692916 RepID=A0A6B0TRH7_9RHOB|nr:hypothetical protein [Oceanomicrobium pacificus]MXU66556.1 hypothetical protein [Oceanomicrobium pacificus]
MPDFVFAYHGGGAPETPEEGEKVMKQWTDWLGGLGDAVVDAGKPVGMSKTVSAKAVEDHGGSNPLMGFSVVKADTMDDAIRMAQDCPHLQMAGATVEVAEALDM